MAQDGAAVKTTTLTNLDASPGLKAPYDQSGGKVHVWFDTYTFAASTAVYVEMARIPPGARPSPNSILMWEALGASTGLSVGDSDDSQRFVIVNSAAVYGCTRFLRTLATTETGQSKFPGGTRYDCSRSIRVYTGGVSASMTGTIGLWLEWSMDN